MKNSKVGITMMSIVLYVILFFAFISFAISISTNLNYKSLSEKGKVYINEQYDKLQYNFFQSAKSSSYVNNVQGDIVFSNNDIYHYDNANKKIYKNSSVLVDNVDSFEVVTTNSANMISKNIYIDYNVSFSKYKQNLLKELFVTVGGNNV